MIERIHATWTFLLRTLMKTTLLLALAGVASAVLGSSMQGVEITLYNSVFPGRKRLPYADDPQRSYNVTLVDIEAMFASHEIAGAARRGDEFRVLLLGDSSIWGFLQPAERTLAEELNEANILLEDGRRARFYNLGYPTMSLFKDLLLLQKGITYQPDLILWFVTLESFPRHKQLEAPLVQWNADPALDLIRQYRLDISREDERYITQDLWDRSLFGSREIIMDQIRHQMYAVMWTATGVDHAIPDAYTPPRREFEDDMSFQGYLPDELEESDLSFDILDAGLALAADLPVVLINEPIFISPDTTAGIRYNFYYPHWAYDLYREALMRRSEERGWTYIDLWDLLPPESFTDTAIHTTEKGTAAIADALILELWATPDS